MFIFFAKLQIFRSTAADQMRKFFWFGQVITWWSRQFVLAVLYQVMDQFQLKWQCRCVLCRKHSAYPDKHGGSTDIPFQQTLFEFSKNFVVTSRKSSLHGLVWSILCSWRWWWWWSWPTSDASSTYPCFSRGGAYFHPFQDHQRNAFWFILDLIFFLSVNSEESLFRCEGQLEEPPLARAVVMSHFFSPWPCATSKAVSPMLTQRERTCCCLKNGVLNCPDLVETSAEECSQTKTNDECLYRCIAKWHASFWENAKKTHNPFASAEEEFVTYGS